MWDDVSLRSANSDDRVFLFELYRDVRGPEMDGWGLPAEQRAGLLRMQFDAQRRSYSAAYPEGIHRVICCGAVPIGRIFVAKAGAQMHLVDIALLTAHRGRGIGSMLIMQLKNDCQADRLPLHLQVLRGNPAQRLYERLGFKQTEAGEVYVQMKWTPQVG